MENMQVLFLLFVILGSVSGGGFPSCITSRQTTETYTHSHELRANYYYLYWKHDGTEVSILMNSIMVLPIQTNLYIKQVICSTVENIPDPPPILIHLNSKGG